MDTSTQQCGSTRQHPERRPGVPHLTRDIPAAVEVCCVNVVSGCGGAPAAVVGSTLRLTVTERSGMPPAVACQWLHVGGGGTGGEEFVLSTLSAVGERQSRGGYVKTGDPSKMRFFRSAYLQKVCTCTRVQSHRFLPTHAFFRLDVSILLVFARCRPNMHAIGMQESCHV
jgi:hypothetical protein